MRSPISVIPHPYTKGLLVAQMGQGVRLLYRLSFSNILGFAAHNLGFKEVPSREPDEDAIVFHDGLGVLSHMDSYLNTPTETLQGLRLFPGGGAMTHHAGVFIPNYPAEYPTELFEALKELNLLGECPKSPIQAEAIPAYGADPRITLRLNMRATGAPIYEETLYAENFQARTGFRALQQAYKASAGALNLQPKDPTFMEMEGDLAYWHVHSMQEGLTLYRILDMAEPSRFLDEANWLLHLKTILLMQGYIHD